MSSTQNAPDDALSLEAAQEPATVHEQQHRKDSAHNLDPAVLDTAVLDTTSLTKTIQASKLEATHPSYQNQTPTPTAIAATQPAPLAASTIPTTTTTTTTATPVQNFCYCLRPSSGTMIGCANPQCEREWFHLDCTEFKRKSLPSAEQSWYCIPCRGWQAELEPGDPGECDDCWRCPKCGEEVVHDDSWLSGRVSKRPKGYKGYSLKKGDR